MSDELESPLLPISDPIIGLQASLQALHQAGQEAFQAELAAAGGALKWSRSRLPLVTALVSGTTDSATMETVVTTETQAFWTGIEARLAECARCPPEGAACEPSSERISPGKVVRLQVSGARARAIETPCERYSEFRMARKLEAAGVDKRLSRVKLAELIASVPSAQPPTHAVAAFDHVVASGLGKSAPVGVELLIEGPLAREYGVALLRSIAKNFPNASLRSEHLGSLVRTAKRSLSAGDDSGFTWLTHPEALLLDGLDADFLSDRNKWGRGEVLWVYERRRDQQLTTIITSSVPAKEAFPGIRVLRV